MHEQLEAMGSTRQDLRLTTTVVTSVFLIVFLTVRAVENNSILLNGYSAVLYCAVMCIGIQWVAWVPASIAKTERFYDLTGGLNLSCSSWIQPLGRVAVRTSESERNHRQFTCRYLVNTPFQLSLSPYPSNWKRRTL